MWQLKKIIKKNPAILACYEWLFQRPIIDVYKRSYKKRVLLSYSTYHFKNKKYKAHSNYQESIVIANVFDQLGYCVDVVNNNSQVKLDLLKYDVIFGEGIPVYQAISENVRARKIYYATGSHPWQCTQASMNRLIEFQKLYHQLPIHSTRMQDPRWGIAASCADAIICIGNMHTQESFIANGATNIELIKPTFHRSSKNSQRPNDSIEDARKTALWFGSYGLLHKGLDLAIEAFKLRPDWTLHVCGYTQAERQLIDAVGVPDNVHIHGFLNIESDFFHHLSQSCLFVILPSCSEGTATSVITAMGRGAMIPMVTKESGVDIGDFGVEIKSLTVRAVLDALSACDSKTVPELQSMSNLAYQTANNDYSYEQFEINIKARIAHAIMSSGNEVND